MFPLRWTYGVGLIGALLVAGLVAGALLFPGGDDPSPPAAATPAATQSFSASSAISDKRTRFTSVVAHARSGSILVRRSPSTRSSARRLVQRRLGKAKLPLLFLVRRQHGAWVQVYLPTRPNLSRGWIRASAVRLVRDDFHVTIQLRRHRLLAWNGRQRIATERIATGRSLTPTPTGTYYLTDLIRPPNPNGFYGPYAFGLSAHSPILTSFEGGDGQIGIHGTSDPSVIGTNVSHGCIRVRNSAIRRLAHVLPLGTPVHIGRA